MYKLLSNCANTVDSFIMESDNLEKILDLAIFNFKEKNAIEGYELEIIDNDQESLFKTSMLSIDPIVKNAISLARKYHYGQIRKGDGLQYIIHILQISHLLHENNFDKEIIASGICHDLLEDTGCSEEEIEQQCGREVLRIVKTVSDDKTLEEKKYWEIIKEKYVKTVAAGGEKAMIVSLCDKIMNLRSFFSQYEKEGETIWSKFNRGKEKKAWFEKEVLKMLQKNLNHPLISVYEKMIQKFESLK
ncbi:bifunctional (p)ppGpp synthetase/guanosine-3',5'-bis(diphosphate) 3'-pyrophosphohydrolase [Candidatus Parcubacteria bacterium]|nr:bifunctional (p)ppGpp synthetase/guanosine-3',5'-bis(diphosphate) 3'-pyrophosphohydrolase [Candidatus Parcubacteria bacterium]